MQAFLFYSFHMKVEHQSCKMNRVNKVSSIKYVLLILLTCGHRRDTFLQEQPVSKLPKQAVKRANNNFDNVQQKSLSDCMGGVQLDSIIVYCSTPSTKLSFSVEHVIWTLNDPNL